VQSRRRTLRKFYAELRLWNDELERESHRDYQEAWAERDKGEHAAAWSTWRFNLSRGGLSRARPFCFA